MNAATDTTDAALLGVLQESVPFVERPFADLGQPCGLTEDETLARVNALKEAKVIRQDRKSTRLNSSHIQKSRMPSSA